MIVVCVKTALNSRLYGFCEIQICIISNYTYKFLIMIMTANEKILEKMLVRMYIFVTFLNKITFLIGI